MSDDLLRAALDQLDDLRLRELLGAAVNAYSPTFEEEPATAVFEQHVAARGGLRITRQPVAPGPSGAPRANLLLQLGPETPGLLLVGHVDTIHAGELSTRFTGARVDGDVLRGLGSADMKSGCAAMVEAALAIAAAKISLHRGLAVALVVGEEEYGDGSLALPAGIHAPLCVIGEPTSLRPCTQHVGYLESRLQTHGQRTHAALASGSSAIHAMLTWMLQILDDLQRTYPGDDVSANPRKIRGGDNLFVVAEHCEALLDLHWRPGLDAAAMAERIVQAQAVAQASHPSCRFTVESLFESAAFANNLRDPRLSPLRSAFAASGLSWKPSTFSSHSDAGIFHGAGAVTVVCGPGALSAAHTADESVSLAETYAAARLYTALALSACAR